jgi:hypothetical protein
MSITPLREAIRRLSSEGLIIMDTHRDSRVADVSASEARELLEVRLSLEQSATELAAHRRTEADIVAMRTAAEKLLPVTRVWGEEAITAHRDFHRAVYTASHNASMIKLLDDLWDKSDRYRRLGLELPSGDEPRTIDLNQHHQILELVASGRRSRCRRTRPDPHRQQPHSLSNRSLGGKRERPTGNHGENRPASGADGFQYPTEPRPQFDMTCSQNYRAKRPNHVRRPHWPRPMPRECCPRRQPRASR